MNAAQYREAIKAAAEFAKAHETSSAERARCFVAHLSGGIQKADPTSSALIWSVLSDNAVRGEPIPDETSGNMALPAVLREQAH